MTSTEALNLAEALDVGRGDLVSLVGGGGKTTAMYRLAQCLKDSGIRAATGTTTKIAVPAGESCGGKLLCASTYEALSSALLDWPWEGPFPILGSRVRPPAKVDSLAPEWCERLMDERIIEALIVEADGAARRPVKAPEAWEPVVPTATTLFVPVVGLSCVGRPLCEAEVFRPERVAAVTGSPLGSVLNPGLLARLLCAEEGLSKGKPSTARAACLLNQAELPGAAEAGRAIARQLLSQSEAFERVVLGALQRPELPFEIWKS